MNYVKTNITPKIWVITEEGHDYLTPKKACTFAIDTETQLYFDGKILPTQKLFKKTKNLKTDDKRRRINNVTWAWQIYEEVNGFFMTNDFETFLTYQCRAGLKFGWCYNASFDFAQIDYELLGKTDKWKRHEHKSEGKHYYEKHQPYTFESLHNDQGARYAYKLWFPYRNADRHQYVHAIEYRDFMKLVQGGLAKLLKDLDVTDNEGNPIRKLKMNYQAVNTDNLTNDEIDYCCNDVKGLYFAIKKFNHAIEDQSNNECHIFGPETNLMTAGGFAKHELLRSLYPDVKPKFRLERYQKAHPLTPQQDKYVRDNHLYRGGISFVNPKFKGKLLTIWNMGRKMNRYDVNSEYPYTASIVYDLVGAPFKMKFEEWLKKPKDYKDQYQCIYVFEGVSGKVKEGMLGMWYNPFRRDYVDVIDENKKHLMFDFEFNELCEWYDDVDFSIDDVILLKKGDKVYNPFMTSNYQLKAQFKKEKNPTGQQTTKLKLNSSIGKLGEKLIRTTGHYEKSADTGAIHFVVDGQEDASKSSMNVIVGALILAKARCYILGKIREICGSRPIDNFVYIDTDSIHAFADYDKADAYALGGLKLEATCEAVKYIAPKTYIDIERINKDGTIDFDAFEVHSKGLNVSAIKEDFKKKQKGKKKGKPTLELIDRKISYGAKYMCLVSMNVQGGKVLVPTEKYLARPELAPDDLDLFVTNYEGCILQER